MLALAIARRAALLRLKPLRCPRLSRRRPQPPRSFASRRVPWRMLTLLGADTTVGRSGALSVRLPRPDASPYCESPPRCVADSFPPARAHARDRTQACNLISTPWRSSSSLRGAGCVANAFGAAIRGLISRLPRRATLCLFRPASWSVYSRATPIRALLRLRVVSSTLRGGAKRALAPHSLLARSPQLSVWPPRAVAGAVAPAPRARRHAARTRAPAQSVARSTIVSPA